MGRKKRKQLKPWCWYCNREFDDEKILIQHQKAKHFKCPFCHRKLFTGPGLSIHCNQVHKEKLDKIPNALPNRTSTVIDIYGMVGVPEVDIIEHERQKLGLEDEPPEKMSKTEESVSYPPPLPPAPLPFIPAVAPPINPYIPIGVVPGVPLPPPVSAIPIAPPPPPPPTAPAPPPPLPTSAPEKSPGLTPKPTFPAYSSPSPTVKTQVPKVPRPTSGVNGMTVDLIHPAEDLSLEELRADVPRYKKLLEAANAPPPPVSIDAVSQSIPLPASATPSLPPQVPLPQAPHMMYPPIGHPLVSHVPIAPGFIPAPAFGIPAVQPSLPPTTQLPPWSGMPPLRF
ncbi:unnamed protein product [Calicophoron daubneyi]|uniref:C2H2-type domain-containing protein n=1 Tax=Calicophoron daubneyi TaxID=300641 RepID=A0AAV2TTK4_CALDB